MGVHISLLVAVVSSLSQGRELSAGMMHLPYGFMMTGGVRDVDTAERTADGKRYGISNTWVGCLSLPV